MQGEFARLVKDDPRFDMELRAFLPRTYNLKAIADYLTGPGVRCKNQDFCAPEGAALSGRSAPSTVDAI